MREKKPKYVADEQFADKFHFFASSIGAWHAKATLDEAIASVQRDRLDFHVYYVPLPLSAPYEITRYRPDAKGTVFLGVWHYEPEDEKLKVKRK